LNSGKKIKQTSDQSETFLSREIEDWGDLPASLPPKIIEANIQPPINTAATVNRGRNIEPPLSKNT